MVAELRGYLDELDRQLQGYDALREERGRVQRALNALDPPEKTPAKPKANGHLGPLDQAKLERLEAYVRAHPDHDLIANKLDDELENMSLQKISELLAILQDRGIVRLDRMARGGGKAYRLVA
jgi:hypothetical protein